MGLDDALRAERERRGVPERRRRLRHRLYDVDEELGVWLRPAGAGSGLPAAGHERGTAAASAASATSATATSATATSATSATSSTTSCSSSSSSTTTASATTTTASASSEVSCSTSARASPRQGKDQDPSRALLCRRHSPGPLEAHRPCARAKPAAGRHQASWLPGQARRRTPLAAARPCLAATRVWS